MQPTVTVSLKSTGTAYVLWLLLGGFGGHKFYLGKPGMGVLYIFTAGLLGIGWLIDLFTMQKQVRAANEALIEEARSMNTRLAGAAAA